MNETKEEKNKSHPDSLYEAKTIKVSNMTFDDFKKTQSLLADIMIFVTKKGRPKSRK